MPQIVCSQHAVDPRSVVIGDRALLSAAEGACATEMCALAIVYFHARVWGALMAASDSAVAGFSSHLSLLGLSSPTDCAPQTETSSASLSTNKNI